MTVFETTTQVLPATDISETFYLLNPWKYSNYNMYHVSAQDIDEHMINVHYYLKKILQDCFSSYYNYKLLYNGVPCKRVLTIKKTQAP